MYIDWKKRMDQYFEWDEMTELRKVKFAKLRLTRYARIYWKKVERTYRRDMPKVTWKGMKIELKKEYLPLSYKQRILDPIPRQFE